MDTSQPTSQDALAPRERFLADLDETRRLAVHLPADAAHEAQVHVALVAAHESLQTAYQALRANHAQLAVQHQATAAALRTSDARLDATVEHAPVGIAYVALDGRTGHDRRRLHAPRCFRERGQAVGHHSAWPRRGGAWQR